MGRLSRLKERVKKFKQVFSKGKLTTTSNHSSSLLPATNSRTADEIDMEHDPADVSMALCISAAGQPGRKFLASTAPQPNLNGTSYQITQSQLPLRNRYAPIFNDAFKALKTKQPMQYTALESTINEIPDSPNERADHIFDKLPKSILKNSETNETVQRRKRFLPSLAALRGITMAAAALDPHKIAPILCASIFFSVDVSHFDFSLVKIPLI